MRPNWRRLMTALGGLRVGVLLPNDRADAWDDDGASDVMHHALYLARRGRLKAVMRAQGVAVAVIVDPINILYATGARNMTIWTSRTPARYLLIFADGPTILYDFFGCEHLARALPP